MIRGLVGFVNRDANSLVGDLRTLDFLPLDVDGLAQHADDLDVPEIFENREQLLKAQGEGPRTENPHKLWANETGREPAQRDTDEGGSLEDGQIANERFLVFINDMLSSGNIPDLFAVDEVDGITGAVANRCKATGVEPTRANCWA